MNRARCIRCGAEVLVVRHVDSIEAAGLYDVERVRMLLPDADGLWGVVECHESHVCRQLEAGNES
jgi:hypothetical protein